MTEMDIETSVYYVHLTRLIAREDFIKFIRRESTKTYIICWRLLYSKHIYHFFFPTWPGPLNENIDLLQERVNPNTVNYAACHEYLYFN
jgi:hypothetical protein